MQTRFDVRHFDEQHALVGHPTAKARQNRGRIFHVLERVIHRHHVEAARGERRHPERSRSRRARRAPRARVARTARPARGPTRRIRAAAARTPPRRLRRRHRECDRRALDTARARDSDSARRGRTARYGAATAWSAPCSRAGIRSNSSAAPRLLRASDSTTRARTHGRSSCAAGARRDRDRR